MTKSPQLFIVALLFFALSAIAIAGTLWVTIKGSPTDWLSYWSSARLLVHHQNPYDLSRVLALEVHNGFPPSNHPLMARNLPNALFLMVAMGWLSAFAAGLLWRTLLIVCLAISVRLTWTVLGRPGNRWYLIAFGFTPVLAAILMGQTSIFALLGIALFLRYVSEYPTVAGAALSLCAIKPHLFLPFGIALLGWMITRRAWRIAVAFFASVLLESLLPLYFDHAVWPHYFLMARLDGIAMQFLPTLGGALRFAIHPAWAWLQAIPAFCGCVWAGWFFIRHRRAWNWAQHSPILLFVSLAATPYVWPSDYAVLLPAVLLALYQREDVSLTLLLLTLCAATFQLFRGPLLNSPLYVWESVIWLGWYLLPLPAMLPRTPKAASLIRS